MQQRYLKEGRVPEEVSDSTRGCGGSGGGGENDTKLLISPKKHFSISI
jgi:hypothetical protein